jgi:hypothetical protein
MKKGYALLLALVTGTVVIAAIGWHKTSPPTSDMQACIYQGFYCFPGDFRNNMQMGAFSPADFSDVVQLEQQYYASLKSGAIGALFGQ